MTVEKPETFDIEGGETFNLDVDLKHGVVPVSKAASSLAALIRRAKTRQQPIIITQKGYPTGVLLPIELFGTLKAMANTDAASE